MIRIAKCVLASTGPYSQGRHIAEKKSGGSVVFLLTFLGLEDLIRAEVDRVRANIEDAVERTVWAGSATVG